MQTIKKAPRDVLSEDQVLREALGIPKGDFRFGAKVSIFNQELRTRREQRGWRQIDLAKVVGVSMTTIAHIESFRVYPATSLAEKIALSLGTTADVLFPAWLKFYLTDKSTKVFVWTIDELEKALEIAIKAGKRRTPPMIKPAVYDPVEEVERHLLAESINLVLQTISSENRKFLALRFGLHGEEPMTLEEVGRLLGISRDQAGAEEVAALRKLRHPDRSRKLVAFLET